MLVLAVHTVSTVTAKVAFATILLQDFITNQKLPPQLKCRQLVPTSGGMSSSLWDVSDPDELLAWLTENISVDCTHQVFEVQEDFGIGLAEVSRARAAERVATGTKDVVSRMGTVATAGMQSVAEFDSKMRISERAGLAVEVVRDSAVVQGTAAVFTKAGTSVKSATEKVMHQPAVASATEVVGTGMRKLGQGFSTFTGRMTRRNSNGASAGELPAHMGAGDVLRPAPDAGFEAAAPATATTLSEQQPAPASPAFTLDDGARK